MLSTPLAKRPRSASPEPSTLSLPALPVPVKDFIPYFAKNSTTPVSKLVEPFKAYEAELRKYYAQKPDDPVLKDGLTNMVPVFAGHESDLKVRARKLDQESEEEKQKYVMPLLDEERKPDGAPAVVSSLKEFQKNFNIFSESSLSELDWNNVVAAGSSVTTALIPVPEKWRSSKKQMREYYHEKLAPASDVDLFLYGLTEEEGHEKIKQIEASIKDSILHEVTTIRTKNAITIVSQYPTRHVQIVLRLYDSISQIITGFDVDCACAAYDGKQVWASPRALGAFATQINTVDLTRRSPSYENRLSKYSHRGFEIYWEDLDRSRVDPTIFERSFKRTLGLARLLVLEKLPKTYDRDNYAKQRREERGRPQLNTGFRHNGKMFGNIKDQEEDEVADWVEEDQISDYHTMVIPYGKKFTASKIERLLYSKDLLLNAEWNKPKDREVNLHRHPCFFGTAAEVLQDCCGFCPEPKTEEEKEVYEKESGLYVSGPLTFIKDDPGRQEVGSFNPITTDDWTEMAYVGNTQMLCQAIIDGDLDYIRSWCEQEGNDPNTRDYVGRTPLHLATINGKTEVVKILIENGAKLIYRLLDGRSALHLAAQLGQIDILKLLMEKSAANEEEEEEKADKLRAAKKAKDEELAAAKKSDAGKAEDAMDVDDEEYVSDADEDESSGMGSMSEDEDGSDNDSETQGFTKVKKEAEKPEESNDIPEDNEEEPDFYDINGKAWDLGATPLHFAILGGHVPMIKLLVGEYGADVLLPIVFTSGDQYNKQETVILPITLATQAPPGSSLDVVQALLQLGATSAQADMNMFTAIHYLAESNKLDVLDLLVEHDGPAVKGAVNTLVMTRHSNGAMSSLDVAVSKRHEEMAKKLLSIGANPTLQFDDWLYRYLEKNTYAKNRSRAENLKHFNSNCPQPIISAAAHDLPHIVQLFLEKDVDPNTLTMSAHRLLEHPRNQGYGTGFSVLDIVNTKIKQLKEFELEGKAEKKEKPETMKDEAHYLEGLTPGTYKYWTAQNRYKVAKALNDQEWADYERTDVPDKNITQAAKDAKQAAVDALLKDYESLKEDLIKRGGKTFQELHPGRQGQQNRHYGFGQNKPQTYFLPYETHFTFVRPDLTDKSKEGYLRLYEAAWRGDLDEVKALTLGEWKSEDGTMNQPLQVAVLDACRNAHSLFGGVQQKQRHNFQGISPFAIATLRGHRQVAKAIVEIALAQYSPGEEKKSRWRLDIGDRYADSDYENSEYESEDEHDVGGGHGIRFKSQIVDEVYTIDNVAAVSKVIKSTTKPLEMIQWSINCPWFSDYYAKQEEKLITANWKENLLQFRSVKMSCQQDTLINYAVKTDDVQLLRFILECVDSEAGRLDEEEKPSIKLIERSFYHAVGTGKTAMLAEMIRTTGAPLSNLIESTGVVVVEKPKYYQGLNVGGKKNKAWADAANPNINHYYHGQNQKISPPLLQAASRGSMESLQWFLTDLPKQEYLKFAEANKNDKRVKALAEAPGGFEKAIESFLFLRSDLVLHCALKYRVPGKNCDKSSTPVVEKMIKYLLNWNPRLLEKRSLGGLTPLHVAAKYQGAGIIKMLLDAGANPRAKDGQGCNALHYMLDSVSCQCGDDDVEKKIEAFSPTDIKTLLLEPSRDGQLPLWRAKDFCADLAQFCHKYTEGADLGMPNELGEYPLHTVVKSGTMDFIRYYVSAKPEVVGWENATGFTPLELAEMKRRNKVVHEPVKINTWPQEWNDSNPNSKPAPVDKSLHNYQADINIKALKAKKPEELSMKEQEELDKRVEGVEKWDLIIEILESAKAKLMEEGRWKRKLVGLNEVNEVAGRIERTHGVRAFAEAKEKEEEKKEQWDEIVDDALRV